MTAAESGAENTMGLGHCTRLGSSFLLASAACTLSVFPSSSLKEHLSSVLVQIPVIHPKSTAAPQGGISLPNSSFALSSCCNSVHLDNLNYVQEGKITNLCLTTALNQFVPINSQYFLYNYTLKKKHQIILCVNIYSQTCHSW